MESFEEGWDGGFVDERVGASTEDDGHGREELRRAAFDEFGLKTFEGEAKVSREERNEAKEEERMNSR